MHGPRDVEVTGPLGERFDEILTPDALELLALLHRAFNGRRAELLALRDERQARLTAGGVSTSSRRQRPSATATGGSRRPRPGWSTAGSRSPARPTRR